MFGKAARERHISDASCASSSHSKLGVEHDKRRHAPTITAARALKTSQDPVSQNCLLPTLVGLSKHQTKSIKRIEPFTVLDSVDSTACDKAHCMHVGLD